RRRAGLAPVGLAFLRSLASARGLRRVAVRAVPVRSGVPLAAALIPRRPGGRAVLVARGLRGRAVLLAAGLRALAVAAVLRLLALRIRLRAPAAAAPLGARPLAVAAAPVAVARPRVASAGRRGLAAGLTLAGLRLLGLGSAAAVEPAEHPLPDARLAALRRLGRRRRHWGRCGRQHLRYGGLLDLHGPLDLLVSERRILLRLDHLVAGRRVLRQIRLVVPDALDRVVRRLHVRIADQHDLDVVPLLDRLDPLALLVQQVVADVHGELRDDLRGALLARLLADEPQDRERERLDAPDVAGAVAAGADGLRRLLERRPQPLPRQLEQPEARDAADLDPRPVLLHRLAEPVLDVPLVAVRAHVDEVDHD